MARVVRLRPACALLLGAVLALGTGMSGCGTDTIDLLPLGAGGGSEDSAAGEPASEAGRGGNAGNGGADVAGTGGNAGSAGVGGGGKAGCSGFGCGGFGNSSGSGSGGDGFDCTQFPALCDCGPEGRCDFGMRCHPTEHVCVGKCDGPEQCGNSGKVCLDHLCSRCTSDQSCEQYGTFQRHVCVQAYGLCLECEDKSDCPPERPLCGDDGRCVECFEDKDCPDDEQCDQLRRRCNK